MKILKTSCTILATLLIACACKENSKYEKPNTDHVIELQNKVLNDTSLFGDIIGLWTHDSILIVHDLKQTDRLQFYNKETGKHLGAAIRKGQGEKEVASIYNMSLNTQAGIFSIYDANSVKVLACQLTDLLNDGWYIMDMPKYNQRPNEIYPLTNNEFVALHGLTRFTKARNGEVIASMNEYPDIPDIEDDDLGKNIFSSNTTFAISPDGKRMVQATLTGSMMQILKLNDSSIEPVVTKYFQKPIFKVVNSQVQITEETVLGFFHIQATDNYIYATILGKASFTDSPEDIYVFDWNGNLVKKLSTNCRIYNFYVDEPDGKIYATIFNEDDEQILVTMNYEI